jgi:hypothetical protein
MLLDQDYRDGDLARTTRKSPAERIIDRGVLERQLGIEPLRPPIRLLQRFKTLQLERASTAELRHPKRKRQPADAILAENVSAVGTPASPPHSGSG